MGIHLVRHALVFAVPELVTDRARIVLLHMCAHAVDKDQRPFYSKGSASLALTFGAAENDAAAERKVSRALADLRAAGFITPDGPEQPRRWKRRWAITLPHWQASNSAGGQARGHDPPG